MCSIFKRIIFTGPAAQPCGAFLVCLSGRLACTLIPPIISSGSRPPLKKQEGPVDTCIPPSIIPA